MQDSLFFVFIVEQCIGCETFLVIVHAKRVIGDGYERLRLGIAPHCLCVQCLTNMLLITVIDFDFRFWLSAVCEWFVSAVTEPETLIRPDAFSVPRSTRCMGGVVTVEPVLIHVWPWSPH